MKHRKPYIPSAREKSIESVGNVMDTCKDLLRLLESESGYNQEKLGVIVSLGRIANRQAVKMSEELSKIEMGKY